MYLTRNQRRTIHRLALAILLAWCTSATLAQTAHQPVQVKAVDAIGMTVSDMDRSVAFYTNILAFEIVSDQDVMGDAYEHLQGLFGLRMRVVRLQLGSEAIVLTAYRTPQGRPAPLDARSNDRWFQHIAIVVSDMERAYQWLCRHQIEHVSTAPQRLPDWNPHAGGIRAFYFKDPDGHPLELIQFPPGKGDPRWQRPTEHVFLGIDHTAIAVSHTEASLKFYRDLLGLKVVGESENYGTEQEHLNNVFGARLRITALRAAAGPGIEFLEYIAPQDGRPMPTDERANDLIHWQTTLVLPNVEAIAHHGAAGLFPLVSSGVVSLPDPTLGFRKGMLVRDPDGHAMQLVEK